MGFSLEPLSQTLPSLPRRRSLRIGLAAVACGPLKAQTLGPVRILVGAPPGGSTDMLARELAPEMARVLGRTVIVENRSGAGGNIAAEAVAKAAPDGQTLLLSFTSHTINASLYPRLGFDPIKDFTPLTMVARSPSVLVAHPAQPYQDLKGLIQYAKARPGQLSFAIGAIGSSLHLAGEDFKLRAGVYIVNIPYRGTNPAIADVVAGHVPLMFAAIGNAKSLILSGKLKALGVTSPQRLAALPEVAPVADTLRGFESSAWFGLFGPARLSPELARPLGDAARLAIRSDSFKKRLDADAAEGVGNSAEAFAEFVKADVGRWQKLVRYSGAKPE
jgi:tripartite-type tricarboxylate transporter receptor subunit TctC